MRRDERATFSRSWWIPAPIALGGWLIVASAAKLTGDGADSAWWASPWWHQANLERFAAVALLAAAVACFAAVGARRSHPLLAAALPFPAELMGIVPAWRDGISFASVPAVLSVATIAGTLFNLGLAAAARDRDAKASEAVVERSRIGPLSGQSSVIRRPARRLTTSLAILAAMLALYPAVAEAGRVVEAFAGRSTNAPTSASPDGVQPGSASDLHVVGMGVGAQGTVDGSTTGGAPAADAATPPDPGATSTRCLGITRSILTPVPAIAESPGLTASLRAWLGHYGRRQTGAVSEQVWMNSGGAFGAGIPQDQVGAFLRGGLAAGLTDSELMGIVKNQSFMYGVSDPFGDGGLLAFIEANPALYPQVQQFSRQAPLAAGWGAESGHNALMAAIPELGVMYEVLAGPLHTTGQDYDTVNQLTEMDGQSGYWGDLARRRLDEVLTYGPAATSADKGMAMYVAASGYLPTSAEALAAKSYWNTYKERVAQVQSGVPTQQLVALPRPPTGAGKPMLLTSSSARRSAQC